LYSRQEDLDEHLYLPIQIANPPLSPVATSPDSLHPFVKPGNEFVTLEHWLYHLQKTVWIMNEKCRRYIVHPFNTLNSIMRKPKLLKMGFEVRNTWVHLMLYLGVAIAEKHTKMQQTTVQSIRNLAVVTGAGDYENLDVNDAKKLFMEGEKYFLGFGCTKSLDTAYKRYLVRDSNTGSVKT
jgi:hypothetical protein